MIIAVTGGIAAGETTICNTLVGLGFKKISLSDMLRREAKNRGLTVERDNLRKIGDELRKNDGNDALAKLAYEMIKKERSDWVVDSILSHDEGMYLKSKGATLLGVVAPLKIRYDRSRDKLEEGLNFDEFVEKDKHDRSIGVDTLVSKADYLINNDGTLSDLKDMLSLIVEDLKATSSSRVQN